MEKETKEITLKTIFSIVLVFGAIVIAFFLIDCLLKGYILEEEDKYEFFKDILIINLSIIAVIFGAIVFWIHLFITERVKNAVAKPLEERDVSFSNYVQGLTLLNNGYICWLTYETTREKKLLDAAIEQTVLAYDHVEMLTDEKSCYLLIKCLTRNNLGYYLAERGYYEDKEFAIRCAKYIKKRIVDYPTYRAEWIRTYDDIMSKKWGHPAT